MFLISVFCVCLISFQDLLWFYWTTWAMLGMFIFHISFHYYIIIFIVWLFLCSFPAVGLQVYPTRVPDPSCFLSELFRFNVFREGLKQNDCIKHKHKNSSQFLNLEQIVKAIRTFFNHLNLALRHLNNTACSVKQWIYFISFQVLCTFDHLLQFFVHRAFLTK